MAAEKLPSADSLVVEACIRRSTIYCFNAIFIKNLLVYVFQITNRFDELNKTNLNFHV